MFKFKLPDIGEGVVEAEIVKWHVQEGEVVAENQSLVEVLTDKATIDIPSPKNGRVQRLQFKEGEIVKVGEVLIEIDDADARADVKQADQAAAGGSAEMAAAVVQEASPASSTTASSTTGSSARTPSKASESVGTETVNDRGAPKETPAAAGASQRPPEMPPRPGTRTDEPSDSRSVEPGPAVQAVPAIRELAKRLQVDLSRVFGTGPAGRIMRRDVERHVVERHVDERHVDERRLDECRLEGAGGDMTRGPAPPSKARGEVDDADDWVRQPLRGLRRVIAERMRVSKSTAAHYTYVDEIDMSAIEEARHALAESQGRNDYSPLVFIAHAVVRVLPAYPLLNSSLDDASGEIVVKKRIHLGVAAATDDGLLVPVIRDAQTLSLDELDERMRIVAAGARDKTLGADELRGSTFTISSLGKLGGLMATPIINYPEVAILGVHAIRKLPRYVGEELKPRHIMNLSLSLDHRVIDGKVCAEFMRDIKEILETASFPNFARGSE